MNNNTINSQMPDDVIFSSPNIIYQQQSSHRFLICDESSWFDYNLKNREGLRILLVEDSPLISKVHLSHLLRMGYEVDVATTGSEAIELFNKNGNYYAVLLDIGLPDMSGVEVCKTIKAMQQQSNQSVIPVIALTTQVDEQSRRNYKAVGIHSIYSKPVNWQRLSVALDKL